MIELQRLRKEARESWNYFVSDKVTHFSEVGGASDELSFTAQRYTRAQFWLIFHVVLRRRRYNHYCVVVEGLGSWGAGVAARHGDRHRSERDWYQPVLKRITEPIQKPQRMLFVGCPSVVRLKALDHSRCRTTNMFCGLLERGIISFRHDRETSFVIRSGLLTQGELPRKVVQGESQKVHALSRQHSQVSRGLCLWNPKDIASLCAVYFHGDTSQFTFNENPALFVESAEVVLCPTSKHIKVSYVEHDSEATFL